MKAVEHTINTATVLTDAATWCRFMAVSLLLTDFDDANGVDDAILGRYRKPAVREHLANQLGGFRMRHRRLHSDAHQALGIVQDLEAVSSNLRGCVTGIAA